MRREVAVSVQGDQWSIRITDWPWYALAAEWLWDKMCWVTRGWIGGHGMPEFMWKIPTGKPRWDHSDSEPWLENSIPIFFMDLENAVLGWAGDCATEVVAVNVDEGTARKLSPDFVAIFDED